MQIIHTIDAMRKFTQAHKDKTRGFVPTMGYLHEGHISLVKEARKHTDIVILSIFVNPLQFGANEDLSTYPKNFAGDIALCEAAGVDAIFAPNSNEIYPLRYPPLTTINVAEMDRNLCGAKRIGHFDGVCTVVGKLFNIVQPEKAFFGRKDIQQLRIIETMVQELNFPVKVIGCDTVRADDGLALSSRNSYLSETERNEAKIVPGLLKHITELIKNGERQVSKLMDAVAVYIGTSAVARLDYLQIVDYDTLQLVENINGKVIIATAIFIGKTRLIDNIILDEK